MNDQTLGDTTPDQPRPTTPAGADAFTIPNPEPAAPVLPLTVEQILEMAKLPERRAQICLRADLQARFDQLINELSTLVNTQGEVLDDAEASMGEETAASKARILEDQIRAVRAEMSASMWFPLFRGLPSDDLAVFNKEHYPKTEGADLTDYHSLLISRCSVEPHLSVDDVKALRKKLSFKSIQELVRTVSQVNVGLGVDVPFLPSSLQAPQRQ